MEDFTKSIESLLEQTTDYGKTSYEMMKLKTIDKTADVVSSLAPHFLVFIIFWTFLVFSSIGLALWLGKFLGEAYYGFAAVGAFYCIIGIILYFFLYKWLKKITGNCFIKKIFK